MYFDSAASAQKPVQVLMALEKLHNSHYGNIHRAAHYMADKTTSDFEETRSHIATWINAKSTEEIIFTRGTTESINLIAHSFGEKFIREGDEFLVSEMEHHSNIVPWQLAAERKNATVVKIPFSDTGELSTKEIESLITPRTRIIAVTHVSNVLGTINPVKEIIREPQTYRGNCLWCSLEIFAGNRYTPNRPVGKNPARLRHFTVETNSGIEDIRRITRKILGIIL